MRLVAPALFAMLCAPPSVAQTVPEMNVLRASLTLCASI